MIKAMLLVSFHAFLRPGETTKSVNSLKVRNTNVKSSSFKIRMTSSKHSEGRQATIKVKATGGWFCPVVALADLGAIRCSRKGNLFCFKNGAAVPYTGYVKAFKLLA